MEALKRIRSKSVVLPVTDVDTDQIIPARFLTTTTRDGLGKYLFHDWRYSADGKPNPSFVLNRPESSGCAILVAGRNFGCGSSREHAPWALLDYGFKAVVSSEIADIFRSNSLKNGLLPVVVDGGTLEWLLANPGAELAIDIGESTLTLPNGTVVHYPIDVFARYCLLQGIDQLGFLQQNLASIEKFEERRPWKP
ncbi:MAG: 3-isopropylmalate dehydratase small subunit [Gammaproteobacteria bacterium]|nr:3-isopropylmalate dehydratase small subunit [Gammaproteobacteria bacterium]MDH4256834.1 3-isopropylmalate dehydratase small subunit [Gammaproteobacteria bacterium]